MPARMGIASIEILLIREAESVRMGHDRHGSKRILEEGGKKATVLSFV